MYASPRTQQALSACGGRLATAAPRTVTASALLLLLGIALGGCAEARVCEGPELCNGRDDNCNQQVDEDFRDEAGRYLQVAHCGSCGVNCDEALPEAAATDCVLEDDTPVCVITACPEGERLEEGACVRNVATLCLPCESDAECEGRNPEARCLTLTSATVCGTPCAATEDCDPGFDCEEGQCRPRSGDCSCTPETFDATFACTLTTPAGAACAGVQRCDGELLGPCENALSEVCNGEDDDCDDLIDEDFLDGNGDYLSAEHCGACNTPCVPPGPNMTAVCTRGAGIRCDIDCAPGFVDTDGLPETGCECELADPNGPPVSIGGDGDCDGQPDDNDVFIYVTTSGNDANAGTLLAPVRSITRGLALGAAANKEVLVARGIYAEQVQLVAGVNLFGGYRNDFQERDTALYPVLIEAPALAGEPALLCRNILSPTRVDGFSVAGSEAQARGAGSTAVYLDGCSSAVTLEALIVEAAPGADGTRGLDASEALAPGQTLEDLRGAAGGTGDTAGGTLSCTSTLAGEAGSKLCDGRDVSGGRGGDAACPDIGCTNGSACANAGCTDFTSGGVCDFGAVFTAAVPTPAENDPVLEGPSRGQGAAPGRAGDLAYSAPTNRGTCNFCDDNPTLPRLGDDGQAGSPGLDGSAGTGCSQTTRFDAALGQVTGALGGNGGAGSAGSGGGGGSAGSGYTVIGGTVGSCGDRPGGAGGGGGSGGCGAPGATGGQGGGASVGIVVRLAGLSEGPRLTEVRVVTSRGGRGGDGGAGAAGGSGGPGGLGGFATFFCARNGGDGGAGGAGGAGGGGGGGCGGSALGIVVASNGDATAYLGQLDSSTSVDLVGVEGTGGRGGDAPGPRGSDGANGLRAALLSVPD